MTPDIARAARLKSLKLQKSVLTVDRKWIEEAIDVPDMNMECAREMASALVQKNELPESLKKVVDRANFIEAVDKIIFDRIVQMESTQLWSEVDHTVMYDRLWFLIQKDFPAEDGWSRNDALNITLRLWSGGISGMKTVATETNDGAMWPSMRARIFAILWSECRWDPIFFAGVRAAIEMKTIRKQPWSLAGLPSEWVIALENDRAELPPQGFVEQQNRADRIRDLEDAALQDSAIRARSRQAELIQKATSKESLEVYLGTPIEDWLPSDRPSYYDKTPEERRTMGRQHDAKVEEPKPDAGTQEAKDAAL